MSEGMNAVYRFESKITNSTGGAGGQTNGNFAFVGLTGGFGSITLGKQNNAAYNHAGAIRDISNWHSYGDTDGSKTANSLSYSYAAESFSMQVAAVMDGGEKADTDGAIDRVEFGLTVGLGDLGKVAIGYEKQEDSMMDGKAMEGLVQSMFDDAKDLTLTAKGLENLGDQVWRKASGDKAIVKGKVSDVVYMVGGSAVTIVQVTHDGTDLATRVVNMEDKTAYSDDCDTAAERTAAAETCKATTSYVAVSTAYTGEPEKGKSISPTYTIVDHNGGITATATVTPMETTYGHKASHISASFGLAGITVALGHTTKDSNSPMMNDKMKTNFLGASGSIGDTGLSWNAWGRNVKNNGHKSGDDRSPWTVGLGKSLGGGAHTFIEHYNADDGEDGTTSVALRVDF